ncbi:MAG: hypothetical protein AB1Z57_06535 [Acidimicrobiia bacterium]
MDRPPAEGPDERYERIPWEQLMPPPGGDRRRWLLGGAAALVVVAVVGFSLGAAGKPTPAPTALPPPTTLAVSVPPPPPGDPNTPMPANPPAEAPLAPSPTSAPLPTEADLRAEPSSDPVADALAAHLASVWTTEATTVDHVSVRRLADGRYRAVLAAAELGPSGRRPLDPIGMVAAARLAGNEVVVDHLQPIDVPAVAVATPQGAVGTVPDPVRDAIASAIAPWPTATVAAVGMDAGRWWVEAVVALPGGSTVPMVLWPDLGVGLGAGG